MAMRTVMRLPCHSQSYSDSHPNRRVGFDLELPKKPLPLTCGYWYVWTYPYGLARYATAGLIPRSARSAERAQFAFRTRLAHYPLP